MPVPVAVSLVQSKATGPVVVPSVLLVELLVDELVELEALEELVELVELEDVDVVELLVEEELVEDVDPELEVLD